MSSSTFRFKMTAPCKKYFKKLRKKDKQLYKVMNDALNDILSDPYMAGVPKTDDLFDVFGYDVYHQGTNYEIAYQIKKDEEGKLVLILLAGTCENFYEELKRYLKYSGK